MLIQTIYQMIIPLLKVVELFKKYYKIVAVGIICLLSVTIFVQRNSLQKKNKEIERITNNIRAYEDIAANKEKHNRVLQLTVEELNTSKDSLIEQVRIEQKKLKIKGKNLTNVSVINTEIKDSVKTVIKHKLIDFEEKLELNKLTTIIVSRKDSILAAKLYIENQQILFVDEKKEYLTKYRNGWVRFWHFDFKKTRIKQYRITNSNPLIKVTDTRVIELPK